MVEEKKSLGDRLKQKREEMRLSLKEAETATSIRVNFLQSIEEGKILSVISPVYAQGFVRQYAAYLGFDPEVIMRENPDLLIRSKKDPEFAYGIGTLEMRGNPGSSVKWLPNLIWIGTAGLILFAAWFVAKALEVL